MGNRPNRGQTMHSAQIGQSSLRSRKVLFSRNWVKTEENRQNRRKGPEMEEKVLTFQTHASYMNRAFQNFEDIIADFTKKFAEDYRYVEFDTLVGTGLSGTLVVPGLARATSKLWAIVRKDDGSHSYNRVEGEIGLKWLFVDDLVMTGNTRDRVKEAVSRVTDNKAEYAGTYAYQGNAFSAR